MKIDVIKIGQVATVSIEIQTDTIEVNGKFTLEEDDFKTLSKAAKAFGYRLVKDDAYAEDKIVYTDET